jgi:hypothetical protein
MAGVVDFCSNCVIRGYEKGMTLSIDPLQRPSTMTNNRPKLL